MLKNVRLCFFLLILCGVAYPLAMTGMSQLLMPEKADGSIVTDSTGKPVGSELIGQSFQGPQYFHGRISSVDYNAMKSGSSNYAPSNPALIARTQKDLEAFLKANPTVNQAEIPGDLLTSSASGLDPHISLQAARIQIPRIAKARGIDANKLETLLTQSIEDKQLGIFGEPRVNVLKLNMALDQVR